MNLIFFHPDNKEIDCKPGQTILKASLDAEIPHAHACGGHARCSSCRVLVIDGLEFCSVKNEEESKLSEQMSLTPEVRLACQTQISGNVSLRRPVLDEIDLQLIGQKSDSSIHSIGEEKEVSLLFADIEGYTAFTESSLPYDVVHMLNRYYFYMGKVIKESHGYIMDYFGDGFLAIFGVDPTENHALDAVNAGLSMQTQMDKLNPYFENLYGQSFNVRIGINTGSVILGTIGLTGMQKLAAIGDAVNFASRIEAANKDVGTNFLVSKNTFDQVKENVGLISEHEITVKGKKGTHTVYHISDSVA